MEIVDLKKSSRMRMVEEMLANEFVATSAYQYQSWIVGYVLDWLDSHGYEVKKKSGLLVADSGSATDSGSAADAPEIV